MKIIAPLLVIVALLASCRGETQQRVYVYKCTSAQAEAGECLPVTLVQP